MRAVHVVALSLCAFAGGFAGGFAVAADGEAPAVTAAGEQRKSGTLGAKPATAGADIVAVLHSAGTDFNLAANPATAAKIEELLKKNASVQISGSVTGDKMTVSDISEAVAEKAADETKKGKMKKNGKGEKKKKKKE